MRSVISGGKNNYTSYYNALAKLLDKKLADLVKKYE